MSAALAPAMSSLSPDGWLVLALVAILGLAVGSHLNVVVYRVPAGRSTVRPASACPKCGHPVRAFDNIPVLSWVLLRGRCRDCRAAISVRYPLVEAGTGALFAGLAGALLTRTGWPVVAAVLLTAAGGVALSLIDVDVHRLPDKVLGPTAAGVVALLVCAAVLAGDFGPLLRAAVAGAGSMLVYFVLALVKPGAMGMGDVKTVGLLGFVLGWFGWGHLLVGLLLPFVLGSLFVAGKAVTRGVHRGEGIPFGPFLFTGALLSVVVGEQVWGWYLAVAGLSG